jgi:hypothetical protein
VKRLVVLLALIAVVSAPSSGADFNDTSRNTASIATDNSANYLRLWSQGTDPAGLTGYATKKGSIPLVPAATGADNGLAVALGAYKNENGATLTRVLTLQALDPLPAGVTSLTVSGSRDADAASGLQPLTGLSFSPLGGAPTSSTVTLTPGQKVQLNLSVSTKSNVFPGNNTLYRPTVNLTVRYPGYAGDFLTYAVPVSVWDGNGAGP